jgi:DNA-binding HxlR family transcriptional regulator
VHGRLSRTSPPPDSCLTREVLDRIGDKWSVYVIDALAEGTRRFGELGRQIDGISQRMLNVTLHAQEQDGLITRQMSPRHPATVEYSLTPLGRSLLAIVEAFVAWSSDHIGDVDKPPSGHTPPRQQRPATYARPRKTAAQNSHYGPALADHPDSSSKRAIGRVRAPAASSGSQSVLGMLIEPCRSVATQSSRRIVI